MAKDGVANTRIATALGVSRPTVLDWRRRFREDGLDSVVEIREGRGRKPAISARKVKGHGPHHAASHPAGGHALELSHDGEGAGGQSADAITPSPRSVPQCARVSRCYRSLSPALQREPHALRLDRDRRRHPREDREVYSHS